MFDSELFWKSLPSLLSGAILSIEIAFISAVIGIGFGTLLGILHTQKSRILTYPVSAYVTLFRGTPMLVQIFFIFYVFPQFGIDIPPLGSAMLAIGLNSAAYMSQIVRSGINTVPKGQIEAAFTLGMSKWQTTRDIVLPQVFQKLLPAFGNEFTTLIKDSSLASVIGVVELTKAGSIIRSQTYDPFTILLEVALIYLIITSFISILMSILEKRGPSHA